jgi:hypothetical protein
MRWLLLQTDGFSQADLHHLTLEESKKIPSHSHCKSSLHFYITQFHELEQDTRTNHMYSPSFAQAIHQLPFQTRNNTIDCNDQTQTAASLPAPSSSLAVVV